MKYVKQFGIILILSFAGEFLHALIPLPIPASIYGILILLLGLEKKWIPLSAVEETGRFLIEIMPIMFIPAAVGLLDSWNTLKTVLVPFLIITVLSTCIVMAATGKIVQQLLKGQKKGKQIHERNERHE